MPDEVIVQISAKYFFYLHNSFVKFTLRELLKKRFLKFKTQ